MSKQRKQSPKKRHWCFTSFLDVLPRVFDSDIVRYCIYQRETCPKTNVLHFQGYIELYDGMRVLQVKSIIGECHLEYRKGPRCKARAYCRKKESAVLGSQIEFGIWRKDVTRLPKLRDLLESKMSLDEIVEIDPESFVRYHRGLRALFSLRTAKEARKFRKVKVVVLVGKTGSGKTRKATTGDDWFIMPCGNNLWFDGYTGQKRLIIDDFYGNIQYAKFLRILDGHALQLPIKGGFIWAQWTEVIITSNAYPEKWYKMGFTPALRRRVYEIIPMGSDSPVLFMSFV